MEPSLSNCHEVPEVNTRLTKLHIPSVELLTLHHHPAHRISRHRGFVSTNEMRAVSLFLKSLWNVSHLLELRLGCSRGPRWSVWGISGSPASHQSCDVLYLHHTLTGTLCDSWYNVISPVPGVWGRWWRLLGPALLASDSRDRRKKCLGMTISGIFHMARRSLGPHHVAHASLTEKLGPRF